MKKLLFTAIILMLFASCTKDDDGCQECKENITKEVNIILERDNSPEEIARIGRLYTKWLSQCCN